MKRISLIIAIAALIGVFFLAGLWIFGTLKVSVVSLDTFIGVSVAVLAIVFSITVGFQIVNAIDVKDKMAELERKQNELTDIARRLAENDKLHTKEAYNLQAGLCGQYADLRMAEANYVEAFCAYHSALFYAILADQPDQIKRVINLNTIVPMISRGSIVNFDTIKQQLVFECNEIRKTVSYRNCLSSAYENTISAFWTKMQVLNIVQNDYIKS